MALTVSHEIEIVRVCGVEHCLNGRHARAGNGPWWQAIVLIGIVGRFHLGIGYADIFFGRDGTKLDWGNSGATVFLYDYGIVGMILLLMMYLSVFLLGSDKRKAISAAIIISLIFMVDGHALWLCYFIPIYATAVSTSIKNDSDEYTI